MVRTDRNHRGRSYIHPSPNDSSGRGLSQVDGHRDWRVWSTPGRIGSHPCCSCPALLMMGHRVYGCCALFMDACAATSTTNLHRHELDLCYILPRKFPLRQGSALVRTDWVEALDAPQNGASLVQQGNAHRTARLEPARVVVPEKNPRSRGFRVSFANGDR